MSSGPDECSESEGLLVIAWRPNRGKWNKSFSGFKAIKRLVNDSHTYFNVCVQENVVQSGPVAVADIEAHTI